MIVVCEISKHQPDAKWIDPCETHEVSEMVVVTDALWLSKVDATAQIVFA